MLKSKATLSKRILSLALFAVMLFSTLAVSVFAASNGNLAQGIAGKYTVPITSLVSAAPIPSVKTAFAKAFGDSVVVTVNSDGTKTALIKNQHMVIDFMVSSYEANVASIVDADASTDEIENATVISTKQEVYHAGLTASKATAITVPNEFTIPLNLDENNSQKLSITVDFMDAFMGFGKPFPTTVTLTLDMEAAVIDVSELNALIDECEAIAAENYTDDTLAVLNNAVSKAKGVAASPKSFEEISNMIAELNSAKNALKYNGADYTAVNAAIAKIPLDKSIYTSESWTAVVNAKNSVVNGLDKENQSRVDGFASDIEAAVASLVMIGADYTSVDKAIASIPMDLTSYNADTVQAVNDAVNAVERGLPANKQAQVDAMALAINRAVSALKKISTDDDNKTTDTTVDEKIDIKNLKDGIYEIPVALWNATQNQASMAASSFNGIAKIVVKDGAMTVYIFTKPMTFGAITASLQEMKVEQSDGAWVNAVVETKSGDGNPTCFSFPIDELKQYVNTKVNPHVEMMGNQDLDARLNFNLNSIKLISENSAENPLTPPVDTNVSAGTTTDAITTVIPQTDDNSVIVDICALAICAVAALTITKKRNTAFD